MKQFVKNYSFYPGDFRRNEKSVDIIAQINHDLKKNPSWSIKLINYINDGLICTVVYDIVETPRRLVESTEHFAVQPVKEGLKVETDASNSSEASSVN